MMKAGRMLRRGPVDGGFVGVHDEGKDRVSEGRRHDLDPTLVLERAMKGYHGAKDLELLRDHRFDVARDKAATFRHQLSN